MSEGDNAREGAPLVATKLPSCTKPEDTAGDSQMGTACERERSRFWAWEGKASASDGARDS
jgi:hypothetical protein